jgi:hypothetical protein
LDLVVPAYFHPLAAPKPWRRLAASAPITRLVIVNVHNGPGTALDESYLAATHALRIHQVSTAGYVDTDYGRRPVADVVADVRSYLRWYGIEGVFLDQVSSGITELDHYEEYVLAVRAAGARFVALNPGTHPHPGYIDLANLTVTFEGTWFDYRGLALPGWVRDYPSGRFCHLVHSVPQEAFTAALQLASQRNVRSVFLTDGCGDNPWDRFPISLTTALLRTARGSDGI